MADATAGGTNNNHPNEANNVGNGQVETSKAERHVWLMKCPPVVSRSLHHNQHKQQLQGNHHQNDVAASSFLPDGPIAKVVVAVDPLLPNDNYSSTKFTMELAGTESGNVPKCYSMDMSTDFIPMSVFSESGQGKLSVEGKIYHKFDMKPHCKTIADYGKLCRERTNKYMTKTRQIRVIDDDSGQHLRPMPGMVAIKASGHQEKRKMPVKGSEMKRTRRGKDEMEEIMFKLFERQPNWTLKQLIQETDQPEQFMKDMLKLLCVYNNKGSNQGTYELKPEYKKSEEEPEPDSK
ncbi:OLC1v1026013C2 [Oldenlandia corymbosa var. corymbosa]|uniref:OLC1v1026013C2 n=1 Tax=Oldenlandia corymbosa var. corymbosa TaxID=529605 RepID=A0AAV1C6R3_OLDCO|nr:OLC1v1026013C2 [Oldenlandia corymbosa var. corymbosa]